VFQNGPRALQIWPGPARAQFGLGPGPVSFMYVYIYIYTYIYIYIYIYAKACSWDLYSSLFSTIVFTCDATIIRGNIWLYYTRLYCAILYYRHITSEDVGSISHLTYGEGNSQISTKKVEVVPPCYLRRCRMPPSHQLRSKHVGVFNFLNFFNYLRTQLDGSASASASAQPQPARTHYPSLGGLWLRHYVVKTLL